MKPPVAAFAAQGDLATCYQALGGLLALLLKQTERWPR